MSLLEALPREGVISASQIGEIKNRAQEDFGGDIDEVLRQSGVAEEKILEAKGKYLGIPVKKVGEEEISFDVLKYISEDSAMHYHFVPIELKDGVLEVGVTDPENIHAMDALQFISNKIGIPFKIFLISKSDYESIISTYKGIGNQVEEALNELSQEEMADAK